MRSEFSLGALGVWTLLLSGCGAGDPECAAGDPACPPGETDGADGADGADGRAARS